MGGYMPYQLEKGPYFSVTESVFDDYDLRIKVLVEMLTHEDPSDIESLESTSLDPPAGGVDLHADRIAHQDLDWYGRTVSTPNGLVQPKFNKAAPKSTGFWHNWYGNAEGIVRETYLRAIEVSFGLPHNGAMLENEASIRDWLDNSDDARFWPIEIFSRCPAPWFEGWVTWQGRSRDDGHVTIHLHTPSHRDSNLLKSPLREPGYVRPDYQDEENAPPDPHLSPYLPEYQPPDHRLRERGMWVIAHEVQELVVLPDGAPPPGPPSTDETPWPQPWFGGFVWSHDRDKETSDKIVVVQPSEPNGGVLADGRPYTP